MLYIGIDPGESWCGFAALDALDDRMRVEARTYSILSRGSYVNMVNTILDILPHNRKTMIVCEDFRIRRSGHQAFNKGNTLRFIGALEYGISQIDAFSFSLIPPSDRGAVETRQLFGRILDRYRSQWPRHHDAAWGHCVSGWRVLGHYLFKHDQSVLLDSRKEKKSHHLQRWLPTGERAKDHVAPAMYWKRR